LSCDGPKDGDCNATHATRTAFSFLLDPIKEFFEREIDAALERNNFLNLRYSTLGELQWYFIAEILWGNKSVAIEMVKDLESLGKSNTAFGQFTLQRFVIYNLDIIYVLFLSYTRSQLSD
jgi:hypothetical protein